jgi:hypothetical protein
MPASMELYLLGLQHMIASLRHLTMNPSIPALLGVIGFNMVSTASLESVNCFAQGNFNHLQKVLLNGSQIFLKILCGKQLFWALWVASHILLTLCIACPLLLN